MRALTLIQPMAWAIVSSSKRIENRPLDLPKWMKGVRTEVAVHAGLKYDDGYAQTVKEITGAWPPENARRAGAIVGLMRLTGHVHTDATDAGVIGYRNRPWYGGPFGYEIEDAVTLAEPVPCRGMMGWWRVPEKVLFTVRQFAPAGWGTAR